MASSDLLSVTQVNDEGPEKGSTVDSNSSRGENHTPQGLEEEDSMKEEESEGEEGGGEGVGQLLRITVEELEVALRDTRQLLASRDLELGDLRRNLDRYKQQAAKEIANKTRLAQALDQSQKHTSQLEELLENWQLQMQEFKVQGERLQSALRAEQMKNLELSSTHLNLLQEKETEVQTLKQELEECRTRDISNESTPLIDALQQIFLKKAIFHLLSDVHAEEQVRAILSILDFSPQERMTVYDKIQQKGGLYK